MRREKTFATRRSPRRPATSKLCSRILPPGILPVACAALGLLGCASSNPRPRVVSLPGDDVPHKIERGQVSEYDGWILPTPLFNRLTPCFKDVLEHPETEDGVRPGAIW